MARSLTPTRLQFWLELCRRREQFARRPTGASNVPDRDEPRGKAVALGLEHASNAFLAL